MFCQWMIQSFCYFTSCCILTKIRSIYSTFKIITKISTTSIAKSFKRTFINNCTFHEFDFRTVVKTRNSAECEHKIKVFCPYISTSMETMSIISTRCIIMAVYVNNIVSCIVIAPVFSMNTESSRCRIKIPVHWEVNYIKTRFHRMVRIVIFISTKKMVVRALSPFC